MVIAVTWEEVHKSPIDSIIVKHTGQLLSWHGGFLGIFPYALVQSDMSGRIHKVLAKDISIIGGMKHDH
jgi:hypothetical protein